MKYDFEDYLKDAHTKDYHGTDDDMSEAYENWLSNMDLDLLILHADKFGAQKAYNAIQEFSDSLATIKP